MASTARCQVSIQSARRLPEALTHDLEALAAQALEPNVFYESWMLGPAVQAWAPPDLLLVTVRDAEGVAAFRPRLVEALRRRHADMIAEAAEAEKLRAELEAWTAEIATGA